MRWTCKQAGDARLLPLVQGLKADAQWLDEHEGYDFGNISEVHRRRRRFVHTETRGRNTNETLEMHSVKPQNRINVIMCWQLRDMLTRTLNQKHVHSDSNRARQTHSTYHLSTHG